MIYHEEKTMKELLKKVALDVVLPWALTAAAGFVAQKLAPKPTPKSPAN